jgi:hypothetical protein
VGLESRFSRQQAAFEAKKLRKVGNEGAWKQPTVQAEGESDGHGAATWAATNTVNTVAAGAASAKRAAALKAKLTGPAAAVFVQLFEAIDADGSGQFEEDEGKVGVHPLLREGVCGISESWMRGHRHWVRGLTSPRRRS